jgi:hypothetical protein
MLSPPLFKWISSHWTRLGSGAVPGIFPIAPALVGGLRANRFNVPTGTAPQRFCPGTVVMAAASATSARFGSTSA